VSFGFSFDGWQDEEGRNQECILMVNFEFALDDCHDQENVQKAF
jgi:hypothetical protein